MAQSEGRDFILGIDLGTNSLGWALVAREKGEPKGLFRAGVRVFEAGMEGHLESGQEQSRNLKRREARLHRRQLWRHTRRLVKVAHALQRIGLLPEGNLSDPQVRQEFFNTLDAEILASPWFAAKGKSGLYPEPRHVMPYVLRAAALDEALEPHFLGRALYHLAQRRGFLSNRLKPAKKGDDEGVVKEGIGELRGKMQEAGSRTLGEYFSHLSPSEERIRTRWTARDMYEKEFNAIWAAQSQHHPDVLTEERRKELRSAIFFQRRLWFDPNTIGTCELEPDCQRAPAYLLTSQRFRLLQTVNNLKVLPPGEAEMDLTPEDRKELIDALELQGDQTFTQIRKLLRLPKGYAFNLERGGEKRIPGNRTNADFYRVFGERWLQMSPEEHDRAADYVHAFQKPDKLREASRKKWGLGDEAAESISEISLEADYMSLSRRAMEKLLPLLEQGVSYGEARRQLYPERFEASEPKRLLPPVDQALAEIRNPAVMRSLTELRKVVNAVIRQHDKPAEIHIELARDLKKPKKQRQAIAERNRENERAREAAAKRILEETGIANPSPEDLRKVLLAEECRWECPYTGKTISMRALVGPESQFQIEHVIPFSRSLDNSFVNLTLCYVEENKVKTDRTPHEAYSGDATGYEHILDRVKRFNGSRSIVAEKLRRFKMTPDEVEKHLSDFTSRQLTDTAYASRLAAQYLGLLYGGVVDGEGNRRVQATSGQVTAYLRNLWHLNTILKDGSTTHGGMQPKTRDDHRHHAVDAVAIALTDAATVKQLSDAAQHAREIQRRRFAPIQSPWPDFTDSVRKEIEHVIVSHRVSKKVSGALHEETVYSAPPPAPVPPVARPADARLKAGARQEVRVRKPLHQLTKSEVEQIADEAVRKKVVEKLGDGDPKKVFSSPANLPFFESDDGRHIPIKRVRIKKAVPTFAVGTGRAERNVASESNHHLEVFAELDDNGNEVEWDGLVVSIAEAYRRKKLGLPIVQCNHGPRRAFKFSLAATETIECADKSGGRSLFVVRKMSHLTSGQIQIGLAPVTDARKAGEMQTSRAWLWVNPNTLGDRKPRKVVVSPLGEVSEAHD